MHVLCWWDDLFEKSEIGSLRRKKPADSNVNQLRAQTLIASQNPNPDGFQTQNPNPTGFFPVEKSIGKNILLPEWVRDGTAPTLEERNYYGLGCVGFGV